ncbi:MAG: hypothetical protein Q6370_025505 [Candidatus Sigynarchaeota archaeon]
MTFNFGKRKPFKFGHCRAIILPQLWVDNFLPDVDSEVEVVGDETQLIIKLLPKTIPKQMVPPPC